MGFSLCFDPALLTFVNVSLGADAQGASLIKNEGQKESGRVGYLIGVPAGQAFPAGTRHILDACFQAAVVDGTVQTAVSFCDQAVFREVSDPDGNALLCGYDDATVTIGPEAAPPQIVHVWQNAHAVRNGEYDPDGPASIQTSTSGLTVCSIEFSEDVTVQAGDIQVRDAGNTVDLPGPSTFAYDPATRTLTLGWAAGTFKNQWVRIHVLDSVTSVATGLNLDGEIYATAGDPASGLALNGQLPSGDGQAGGAAMFVLGALTGDLNGNGQVRVDDLVIVRDHLNQAGDLAADVTGDGQVRANDLAEVRNNLNASLPALLAP